MWVTLKYFLDNYLSTTHFANATGRPHDDFDVIRRYRIAGMESIATLRTLELVVNWLKTQQTVATETGNIRENILY